MINKNSKIKLFDGNCIPYFGLGCYNAFGDEMTQAVRWALEVGYRYIDSASCYKNEAAVGNALRDSKISRDDLFILSKVWPADYDDVEQSLVKTMKDLQVDYLDCYLLHWPTTDSTRRLHAYEQLLSLHEKGLFEVAGVSNFLPEHLEEIYKNFGCYPPLNELEVHPCFQQSEAAAYHQSKRIQLISYTPTGRGAYLNNDVILDIASAHNKSPNQAVLRWHIQKKLIPIPKSSNYNRINDNINIFDFELTPEEMARIDALECGQRRGNNPLIYNG